ncbi:F0F1 ATP synthase subunit delta [Coxiella endosymbiont of Amblyomma sculptum]|uniref:F0F1 ATP synthase subunit delta n=1 Tax=Coxiella endosymbiont of Amblyomma sculptum TaxID=2487929 RepID=UPI00132EBF6B|nr:F0F1 ATP synthase subunit delta [Coxiella endosymbiont of Amblyomma sculptum]QHG92211.1 F0F1 ATP synthase subunit delta [Coxiella endosymbiont of Amblyomma sculptum]
MALYLTLARPYASALFMVAKESNQLFLWLNILKTLTEFIKNKSVLSLINNPNVPREKVKNILFELLCEKEPEIICDVRKKLGNFLQLLLDRKKLIVSSDIALLYKNLLNDSQGVLEAKAVSAFPLNSFQKKQIKKKLEKRFIRKIKLRTAIDKSLIGGCVIYINNWVIDGSVREILTRLAKSLRGKNL